MENASQGNLSQKSDYSKRSSKISEKFNLTTLICPECKSSIRIKSLKFENYEYIFSFICQNNHIKDNISLNYLYLDEEKETKENFDCSSHKGEKFNSYCSKCKLDLCNECLYDEDHENHQDSIEFYSKILPKRNEIKDFLEKKKEELNKVKEVQKITIEWINNLRKKFEKLFQDKIKIIELEKNYITNATPSSLNYYRVGTINYFLKNMKDNFFNKIKDLNSFDEMEKKIFDFVIWGDEKIKSKNNSNSNNTNSYREKGKTESLNKSQVEVKIHIQSDIIKNNSEWKTIIKFLDNKPKELIRLYSAIENNGKASSFHDKCNGQGPTLTIIETDTGEVFGGYTSKNWSNSEKIQEDKKAFLFDINMKEKCCARVNEGIRSAKNSGPCFYAQNFGSVLFVSDNCLNSKTSFIYFGDYFNYKNHNKEKNGSNQFFKVVNYETFKVIYN